MTSIGEVEYLDMAFTTYQMIKEFDYLSRLSETEIRGDECHFFAKEIKLDTFSSMIRYTTKRFDFG